MKLKTVDLGSCSLIIDVLPDVAYRRLASANVVFLGTSESWVLVDTGVTGASQYIREAALERFGPTKPEAIIITHAHDDQIGSVKELADEWNVPVYAHPEAFALMENSITAPTSDSSLVSEIGNVLSNFFPRNDSSEEVFHLVPLPSTGLLPHLNEWRWIATPGHSPGHISLWRDRDKFLIAGDALLPPQEVQASELGQRTVIDEKYERGAFDPVGAEASLAALISLRPDLIIPSHGVLITSKEIPTFVRELGKKVSSLKAFPERANPPSASSAKTPEPVNHANQGVVDRDIPLGEVGSYHDGQLPIFDENISTEPGNSPHTPSPLK